MKLRYLGLIPLLLVSCSNEKVYYNVAYHYDYASYSYVVEIENKTYNVKPSKFYLINVEDYLVKDGNFIRNEFYSSSKELFVYHKQ